MIKYNDRLGFLPYSSFVDLNTLEYNSLNLLYDKITSEGCNDIIFIGNIPQNRKEQLKWLFPRLISEQYFISIITDLSEFDKYIASRVIVVIDLVQRNHFNKLENLSQQDIIYINEKDYNLVKKCITMINSKAKIYCDKIYIDNLIKDHYWTITPTDGELLCI
jgi:hypothetical protein